MADISLIGAEEESQIILKGKNPKNMTLSDKYGSIKRVSYIKSMSSIND